MGTWVARNAGLSQPQNRWWLASSMDESRVKAVYQPLGASGIAASYVNLNGASEFDANPVVAPTFATATGWTFTGTQHLTTNITGTGLQSIMVRFTWTGGGTRRGILGYDTGSRQHYMEIDLFSGFNANYHNGYNITETVTVASFAGQRANCMARNSFYSNGVFQTNVGSLDSWNEGTITIGKEIVGGSSKFSGTISGIAIYNDQLSSGEVSEITTNLLAVTSADNPVTDPWPVNWIVQNPATKRLNKTSHELWIATDGGIFHTTNGGIGWAKITLPDPSNAEFSDSPAATVDELTFHWIDYDPSDPLTLLAYGAKTSSNRIWAYKTTNLWASGSISSRGVVA